MTLSTLQNPEQRWYSVKYGFATIMDGLVRIFTWGKYELDWPMEVMEQKISASSASVRDMKAARKIKHDL